MLDPLRFGFVQRCLERAGIDTEQLLPQGNRIKISGTKDG